MLIARRDEIEWQPGCYYHLHNRGARQLSIFREADNYVFVLRCVKNYLVKLDLTVDAHLLQLCRYIHANPVKDGMTTRPIDWPYSNYLEWIGGREGTLVDHDFITSHFSSAAEYEVFVLDYLRTRQLPEEISIYLEHDNL
jgi:putative transposase